MNTSKGWYNTVLQINNELESRAKSDHKHPLDLLLMEQTNTLIQLFNDCEFVGFPKTDPEAETIVSNVLVNVQNSLSDKMDFVPDNPFFNLYLGLLYLEKVLQIIKQEYESNLNTTLEHLENIIYRSNDYQNLVEVSRNIGRKIINKQQHPEFGKLKQHIAEQLEYIERTNKIEKTLPPQQSEKPKPEPKETDLSERIKKHFGFFNRNCPRKHKQILNDTDFEKLIEWTIWYFENDFKVPEISEPIEVVNTNKTFVQLAFKYLFKKLHKSSPYPETLFKFYQSAFNPYSEDKKSNFEAVKNNDEVKKLMQID